MPFETAVLFFERMVLSVSIQYSALIEKYRIIQKG